MTTQPTLLTIGDYEARAKQTMPQALFDRLFGDLGAHDWITNTTNVQAMSEVKLRPRILVDVTQRDMTTTVLGEEISMPVMLAPTGTHQRAHPMGELASTRAAGGAGTILGLSTASSYSIEEVAGVATNSLWFQLYFFENRELTEILVRRAEQAGYKAMMLTVDNLGANSREREYRYAYTLDQERTLKNFEGIELPNLPTRENFAESFESGLNWSDLEWLRSITSMPLVIKGVQTAEDARLCAEYGCEAGGLEPRRPRVAGHRRHHRDVAQDRRRRGRPAGGLCRRRRPQGCRCAEGAGLGRPGGLRGPGPSSGGCRSTAKRASATAWRSCAPSSAWPWASAA